MVALLPAGHTLYSRAELTVPQVGALGDWLPQAVELCEQAELCTSQDILEN